MRESHGSNISPEELKRAYMEQHHPKGASPEVESMLNDAFGIKNKESHDNGHGHEQPDQVM